MFRVNASEVFHLIPCDSYALLHQIEGSAKNPRPRGMSVAPMAGTDGGLAPSRLPSGLALRGTASLGHHRGEVDFPPRDE